tara:strand:- start:395 stop:3040 length:2646 start_codon:yes stop_codon:yes gene_type:complete
VRVPLKRILDLRQLTSQSSRCLNIEHTRLLLDQGRQSLRAYHDQGAPAQEIVSAHARMIDQILVAAWSSFVPPADQERLVALIAVGGYGREELQPSSDIDILVLFQRTPGHKQREFTGKLIRFLWDIGLNVGHSVRTLKECTTQCAQDVTVMTNLMESRLLSGNQDLLIRLRSRTDPSRMWTAGQFIKAKLDEQITRHLRYNDTAYNLEPHLKEGPGGLRDIHTMEWIAQRCLGVANLRNLIPLNYLTETELRGLIRGKNFLWRLRNALHFLSDRSEDRLLFDYQREIASQFGYTDSANLAVEKLMKRYYRTAREIRLLNEFLLQQIQDKVTPSSSTHASVLNRRFQQRGGYVEARQPDVFQKYPFALLEVFLLLQQNPDLKGIRAGTVRLIRSNLKLINSEFRRDIRCRSLFMEIMRAPLGQTRALRQMTAYGILGAYIPQFGRIVGQMQHDLFHVYTVDAHLLFVIRNLRRLELPEHELELPHASRIMNSLFKRHRLFLAALFHDISKGQGGDHSQMGETESYRFCKRHDMSDYDCHFVSWLVRNHLLMSWTAQREDISDPDVIDSFARQTGDQEHLDNLYLLTVADIRGTSPHVWNDWKGKLLSDLHAATSQALRRDRGTPIKREERIIDLKNESFKTLRETSITKKQAIHAWQMLNEDYFLRNKPEDIAWHTQLLVSSSLTDVPIFDTRTDEKSDAIQVFVCSTDSQELLCDVTAGFDQENLNIVDARVHKVRGGLVIMVFVVLSRYENQRPLLSSSELVKRMKNQILNPRPGKDPKRAKLPRTLRHFQIDTVVRFNDRPGSDMTVLEVIAQDRPGLLHHVAKAFLRCKISLISAKVSTFGERAEDIFYITDRDGRPIDNSAYRDRISRQIMSALPS